MRGALVDVSEGGAVRCLLVAALSGVRAVADDAVVVAPTVSGKVMTALRAISVS